MGNYPPPPGSGWSPPPGGWDPHADGRALAEWCAARGVQLNPTPDLRWYQAWAPFAYLFPIARLGRELRLSMQDASVCVTETFEGDPIKQATGEDKHVVAFVMSPRLAYRAAVRSRQGSAGILHDVSKGLDDLFGSKKPQGLLGDPTFESAFEVVGPTRDEANAALPQPLRQLLLQTAFRGILEVRAQGLIVTFYARPQFDPATLEGTIGWVSQIHQAATQYAHVITPTR